ncbi:PqiC family protein [Dickeya fangzhongdai]|uniref:PqiC family protein n=1 Tax=Dickeya fangzhongdai TaxID=1778540 RepID=UPI0026DF5AAB|nr:PqiC family protein [Dickeya fangzhongdai]WKV51023.1 PqiC family protein [Dickeya fangzhongdai]
MKLMLPLLAVITVLTLPACRSPQVRYHTLVPPVAGVVYPHPASFAIDLLPINVPAQVDRQQVVIRDGQDGAMILDNDRWLSPLSDEIHTALSSLLVQRSGAQNASVQPLPRDIPVLRIRMQIRRFDSWPGQFVSLDADWSLTVKNGDKRLKLSCRSQLTESAVGDNARLFSAWQKIIEQVATQMTETARRWQQHGDNIACQS